MKNLKQAKKILKTVKNYDDKLLSRTTGLSETLSQLLKDYLPEGLLDDIKEIDKLTVQKKRALIDYISKAVEQIKLEEEEKKEKTVNLLPLEKFFSIQIKDLKLLKPIEKRAFKKVGIQNLYDALFFFPKRYDDRRFKSLSKIKDGETGLFRLEVLDIKKINRGKLKVQVFLKQGDKKLNAFFVHDKPFLFSYFRKGKEVILYGKVSVYGKDISIIQPEIYNQFDPVIMDRIVPVYSLRGDSTVKITSQTINHLRRGIFKILKEYLPLFPEYMPENIRKKYKLPGITEALKKVHFPDISENIKDLNNLQTRPQTRVIFDELFILELAYAYRKNLLKENPAEAIKTDNNFTEKFESILPFKLTEDQKKAIKDILNDISKPSPMNRMVQGDVGSGKTVVAIAASLAVAQSGNQVAVMAPTEILAQQHYRNFKNILGETVEIYLLTGSTPNKEKKKIYRKMETGEAKIVIGTHALIQDEVKFKNLALVIVDEQHRFGVEQRKALIEKSGKVPHVLVMTATPIPRTLALTYFGDLDVSVIKQLPSGRKKVETMIYYEDEREVMNSFIRKELEKGRQVFVVYPLIEDSEKIDLKSAEEGFKKWKEAFPDRKVILLHGRMSQEEKDRIMEDFRNKKADILVSTTVIEVGVDIPNASVMVIEDAYRFGLSQIHQLRGRVGRGKYKGYCFLVVPEEFKYRSDSPEIEKKREKALQRLKILVSTTDGFKIAEEDFKLRGSGDIIGTAQSGKFYFGLADPTRERDSKILEYAKKEAEKLIEEDPHLEKNPLLKELVYRKYGDRFNLVNIA
ncbi:ATP-dependent DNA helicase RecG [Persephonella hydrogeniphila]|uniref:ATP-dependent DNA helicase RecG n=1 Tax=Persephonella hydrogeniphila TaxID=198703 RepID=A0A285N244_9AQUI|nr:ATP-dependent DNA helicase RecG [Persephonella hydrogeniphila]SNZ03398.1 ATP-dependent DNA helicase RecG [Persephonella hydrogeniphila]